MPQSPQRRLPDDIKPEYVLFIALTVLKVHYERKERQIKNILVAFDGLNEEKFAENWAQLKAKCGSDAQALRFFAEWLDASLDGGDLMLPETG